MTNLPSLPNAPSRHSRAALLSVLAAALCALFSLASIAGAEVVKVGGATVGVAPRVGAEGPTNSKSFANPEGNPVVHNQNVFVIYWDPTDHIAGDWQEGIDAFLQAVGSSSGNLENVFSVTSQYTDKSNVPASYKDIYRGAYTDTTPYPANACTDPNPMKGPDLIGPGETPVCIQSSQVATELGAFIASHGLPKGMSTIYYVITPPGATVCLDEGGAKGHCSDYAETKESYDHSFCSYHGDVNAGGLPSGDANTILYGVVPFDSAGSIADYHLLPEDERRGRECQDGQLEEQPNQIKCPDAFDGSCDHALFDLIANQLWLQQQNIITDPLLNAWQDSHKAEAADQCRFFFGPVTGGSTSPLEGTLAANLQNQTIAGTPYYLNDAFNLAGLRLPYPGVPCLSHTNFVAKFTSPNPVNVAEAVGFDGMESNISQNAGINYPGGGAPAANYATYKWNFGDGTTLSGYAPGAPVCEAPWLSPCAASAFHTYTYGGTYSVTLTVTDVGGNVTSVEHQITVVGPPAPAPGTTPGGTTPGSKTPGGTSGGTTPSAVPVIAAAIVSHGLKATLTKGLSVRYSVNEQVAGRFEVLISAALAKKLKLPGSPVTGLPAGTPPQVMIAKAILVTTKAGRSTVQIKFSKAVAARLHKAHRVPLLLRMFVRNASAKTPATTTALSSVTLVG